jgi:hypothetical protein
LINRPYASTLQLTSQHLQGRIAALDMSSILRPHLAYRLIAAMNLRLTFSILPSLLCLCISSLSHADFYYWKNAEGNLVATDQTPPAGVEFRKQSDLPRVNIAEQAAKPVAAKNLQNNIVNTATTNSVENTADTSTTQAVDETPTDLVTVKLSPNAAPVEIAPAASKATATTAKKPAIDMQKVLATNNKEPTVLSSSLVKSNDEQTKPTTTEVTVDNLQKDDEAGCQKIYGISCDKAFNWRDVGNEYCANYKNDHCSDAAWFEKRFKPLTIAQRQKNTLRNAAQNNQDNEEIRNYLHSKYTGICAIEPDSAPLRCNNKAYDAKIMETFSKLSAKDQADIRHLQQVLKTSKDRSLLARSIEKLQSYFQAATTAATAL